jgi:hypothetical protein
LGFVRESEHERPTASLATRLAPPGVRQGVERVWQATQAEQLPLSRDQPLPFETLSGKGGYGTRKTLTHLVLSNTPGVCTHKSCELGRAEQVHTSRTHPATTSETQWHTTLQRMQHVLARLEPRHQPTSTLPTNHPRARAERHQHLWLPCSFWVDFSPRAHVGEDICQHVLYDEACGCARHKHPPLMPR